MKVFKFVASAAILAWASAAQAQQTLSMWYHGAGNEVESKIINQIINDFNASQSDWKVELQSFPQAPYNDSVVAGALAGNLPDILDVDGPVMPNWGPVSPIWTSWVCGPRRWSSPGRRTSSWRRWTRPRPRASSNTPSIRAWPGLVNGIPTPSRPSCNPSAATSWTVRPTRQRKAR